jgi:hypothetical protein
MISLKGTKKYRNLIHNPAVSLLIDTRDDNVGGDRRNVMALTVRGVFLQIEDRARQEELLQKLLARHPQLKDFAGRSEAEAFQVSAKSFELLEGVSNAYYVEID